MTKIGTFALTASTLFLASSAMAAWGGPVPELDPGSASLGVTLLVGGLLALRGRRRKH